MLDLSDKALVQAPASTPADQAAAVALGKLPTAGKSYRHYKGGIYHVEGLCTVEATQEAGVLYRSDDALTQDILWLRPVSDFFAPASWSGERFTEIVDAPVERPALRIPDKTPVVGRRYRHYKGGLYRVEGLCVVEATLEMGVLYRSMDPHARQDLWLRPVSDFLAAMEAGGERFSEIHEPAADAMLRALPASLVPATVRERVLARYDEPGRFFHARWHVLDLFERAERAGIALSPEQAVAILFHDAVYVPGVPEGTNERLSAMLLRDAALQMGPFDLELSCRIIEDTATHQASCPESEAVLDLDLAVLAEAPLQFCVANELVWLENRHLLRDSAEPRRDFDTRRLKFLLNLVQQGPLFHTALLGDLESVARENLEGLRQAWVAQYSPEKA
jgi:predicted metal-dependent HD superfamily phosphohydrolase